MAGSRMSEWVRTGEAQPPDPDAALEGSELEAAQRPGVWAQNAR
jgi:hypothetical protein